MARLALVAGSLVLCLHLGLPRLGALSRQLLVQPALWAFFAPLLGCLCAMLVALLGIAALHRGGSPSATARLPARIVLTFAVAALVALGFGALLQPHPLVEQRPLVVLIGGPTLVLVHALLLKILVRPPLMRELARVVGSRLEARQERPRIQLAAGGLSIRTSLALNAGLAVLVSLSLIGIHVHCMALDSHERTTDRHLSDLLQVVKGQLTHLPGWQVEPFIASYPVSARGTPVLLDPEGKLLTLPHGEPPGTPMIVESSDRCRIRSAVYRCAVSRLSTALADRLAVILPLQQADEDPLLGSLGMHLVLVVLTLLAAAALMGWFIGNDISRDFNVIANQLDAMARQHELDLGRPVTVTSIDEVGDLIAGLGTLRSRLDSELAEYGESLQKTRAAEDKKREFFSNVSQEIRIPLTTLSGYSQLLLEEDQGPLTPTQQEDIQSIHRGGQQLLALVNDVLDLSVIESGQLQLNRQQVDLGRLCRDLIQGHRHALKMDPQKTGRVALIQELEDDLPPVVADPRRLEQLINNLVSNAIKFTNRGSILVGVSRQGPASVSIQVQDTGIGISSVDIVHIFDRYRQTGDLRLKRKGSGLGLAICKHLAELHGGSISVRSEVELGSTFTVVLPLECPEEKEPAS